uniref:Uncharacterized protein n=1 Tax=Oryza punctata TaxID=4537 RepID=A0A0E0M5G8_ORYPU
MDEDDDTVAFDGGGQRAVRTREEDDDILAVEAKALLRASLSDVGQRFHHQGGDDHLGQEQQPTDDGWLLLHNDELISIPRILP